MSAAKKNSTTLGGFSKPVKVLGIVWLVTMLSMIAALYHVAAKRGEEEKILDVIAEQQLLSQRIAASALEAVSGKEGSFNQLANLSTEFDNNVKALRSGEEVRGIPALPSALESDLAKVESAWSAYKNNIDNIIDGRGAIAGVKESMGLVNDFIPQLETYSSEVVDILVSNNANPQLVNIAGRQLLLLQRVQKNINVTLAGGEGAAAAADEFGRDTALFGRVLEGMRNGNPALRIDRIRIQAAQDKLEEASQRFNTVSEKVGEILELSPKFFELKNSADQIGKNSSQLLRSITDLKHGLDEEIEKLVFLTVVGVGSGIVAILVMVLLGVSLVRDSRRREEEALEQNRRNQRAILRLLDEMANLAEGDLTVNATVTEEITGAIADSVNYAIEALRSLVATINKTAVEVSTAVELTQSTATRLSDASTHQAREISSANAAITDMAESMESVYSDASNSAEVAERSREIAQRGAAIVRNTTQGMDSIREQIQETSKRIKRLGESSQEIGDIVGLITEIADQTNILALNAAIQASTAGEAGRGFAVVADEVQRLAERASNATKQIEALVKTIQADTSEAVHSMEQSTAGVVKGAKLAEDAGEALTQIEDVSRELATLIKGISESARTQAAVAKDVSNTMNVIQEITQQTSEGTEETSTSIGNLNKMAAELRKSVSGFKLPDGDEEMETVVMNNF